jgi:hypothetical protein
MHQQHLGRGVAAGAGPAQAILEWRVMGLPVSEVGAVVGAPTRMVRYLRLGVAGDRELLLLALPGRRWLLLGSRLLLLSAK